MSQDHSVADRLVTDARKKTARQESPVLAKAAMIVGIIAALVSPISIAGWATGVVAIVLGGTALSRKVEVQKAKIGLVLGVVAILVGVFFFTLNIAMR